MADTAQPQLPSFAMTILQSLGQHAGTLLAGVLVSAGVLSSSKSTEVVDLASALLAGAGALTWTFVMHRLHKDTAVAVAENAAVTGKAP